MNKKTIIIISLLTIFLLGLLFLMTGRARTDVYLKDFKLAADGKSMTLEVGVSSSSSYVRKMKRTGGSTNYYYTFYSTFGFNSKIGANSIYTIDIDNNVDEIYFYTGGKGYKKVLQLNEDGNWEKVLPSFDSDIKIIVDRTKEIKDFSCDTALESFYEDEKYIYFWNCIKNDYVVVKYNNGYEENLSIALKNGTVTINDLDNYSITYIKQAKQSNDNQNFKILIKENNKKETIFTNKFNKRNIYYYSLDKATVSLENIEYDLSDAISSGKISLETIVANMDIKGTFYDGGSKMYSTRPDVYSYSGYYYNILVCNTHDGDNDIYIGPAFGDNELKYQSEFCK